MKSWAREDQPAEKILLKGTGAMSDAELISVIAGIHLDDARTILTGVNNNLFALWKLGHAELTALGLSDGQARRILAMFALSRRRNESEVMQREKIIRSSDAFQIFKSLIGDLPHEEFYCLLLNKANKVIKKVRISEGGLSGTVVDPKKIFQIALENHAASMILGHNHPSGQITPSEADTKITRKIKDAGTLLEIAVLDHIIVGDDCYYSYADEGAL